MTTLPSDDRETLISRAKNHLRSLITQPDVSDTSDYGFLAAIVGTASLGLQLQAQNALRNLLPHRASGEALQAHAAAYAADLLPAKAQGYAIILGTGAATVSTSNVLKHPDGRKYVLREPIGLMDASDKTVLVGEYATRHWAPVVKRDSFPTPLPALGEIYQYADPDTGVTKHMAVWDGAEQALTGELGGVFPALPFSEPLPVRHELDGVWGAIAPIEAVEAGEVGNGQAPDKLYFESTVPANVTDGVHVLWIEGGRDAPTAGEVRQRIYGRLSGRGESSRFASVIRMLGRREHGATGSYQISPDADARWKVDLSGHPDVAPLAGIRDVQRCNDYLAAKLPASSTIGRAHRTTFLQGPLGFGLVLDMRVSAANRPPWVPGQITMSSSTHERVFINEDPDGLVQEGDPILLWVHEVDVTGIGRLVLTHRYVAEVGTFGGNWWLLFDAPVATTDIVKIEPGSPVMPEVIDTLRRYYWSQVPPAVDGDDIRTFGISGGFHKGLRGGELSSLLLDVEGVLEASCAWCHNGVTIEDDVYTELQGQVWRQDVFEVRVYAEGDRS